MMQQTSNFGPYYVNPYIGIYPNQFAIGHHSTSAAQHATGTPLYGYSYPYHPGIIYPAAVMPVDYVLDEKSDDGMGVRLIIIISISHSYSFQFIAHLIVIIVYWFMQLIHC